MIQMVTFYVKSTFLSPFPSYSLRKLRRSRRPYRNRGLLVHRELKDVWAGVVAHDVEVEFPANDVVEVDIGRENRFLVVDRTGNELAQRTHNAAAATGDDRARVRREVAWIVLGVVAAPRELIAGEHEAPALERDVPHARHP